MKHNDCVSKIVFNFHHIIIIVKAKVEGVTIDKKQFKGIFVENVDALYNKFDISNRPRFDKAPIILQVVLTKSEMVRFLINFLILEDKRTILA